MNERPLKVSASTTNAEFSTLVEILRWRALNHPDQKAYTFLSDREEEHSLTYAELDRQARAIGAMTSGSTAAPKGVMVCHSNLISNHRMLQSTMAHLPESPFVSCYLLSMIWG
jgi:acyl-CoA synthetase (AMP-forming)/AMP-acid ligase II